MKCDPRGPCAKLSIASSSEPPGMAAGVKSAGCGGGATSALGTRSERQLSLFGCGGLVGSERRSSSGTNSL